MYFFWWFSDVSPLQPSKCFLYCSKLTQNQSQRMATLVKVENMATKSHSCFSRYKFMFCAKNHWNFFLRFSEFTPQPPNVVLLFFSDCAEHHGIKNSVKKSEAKKTGAFVCGKIISVQKNITKRCSSGDFRQFPAKAKIIWLDFLRLHSRSQLLRKIGKKSVSTKKPFSNRKKISAKNEHKSVFWGLRTFFD